MTEEHKWDSNFCYIKIISNNIIIFGENKCEILK